MIRLQQLRIDQELSVRALAAKAGVTHKVIYRLEQTGKVGDIASLHKLAKALGCDNPSELLMAALPPARSTLQDSGETA